MEKARWPYFLPRLDVSEAEEVSWNHKAGRSEYSGIAD